MKANWRDLLVGFGVTIAATYASVDCRSTLNIPRKEKEKIA